MNPQVLSPDMLGEFLKVIDFITSPDKVRAHISDIIKATEEFNRSNAEAQQKANVLAEEVARHIEDLNRLRGERAAFAEATKREMADLELGRKTANIQTKELLTIKEEIAAQERACAQREQDMQQREAKLRQAQQELKAEQDAVEEMRKSYEQKHALLRQLAG